jgi:beta-glucosidase/6-phospho-beta-glucosidase/beta-galactosidase
LVLLLLLLGPLQVMRRSQPKLPKFKEPEKRLLAGSVDFLAVNYYTSHFVKAAPVGAPKDQVRSAIVRDLVRAVLCVLSVSCYC